MSVTINAQRPYYEAEYGSEYECEECGFEEIKSLWNYCPICGSEIIWITNEDENDTSNTST